MVLDIKELHEWRYMAKDGSCVLPWLTRPALDVLESIDLSDKKVWEYGLGLSTIYFAKKAKVVWGVDSNKEWYDNVSDTLYELKIDESKWLIDHRTEEIKYVNSFCFTLAFDIIVVDGESFRDACTIRAIQGAKEGAIIILDNWMQPSVHLASQEVQDLVNKYPHTIYKEKSHPDWQTLIMIK